jgi:hypothetical protein
VLEVDQRLRVGPHLDRDRDDVARERVEEGVGLAQFHVHVAAHALLAGQPVAPGAAQLDPAAAEPDLADAVARGGPHGRADVVRELGVDERYRRGDAITPDDGPCTIVTR